MAAKSVKVLKFGGTSMGSAETMRRVISIIRKPQKPARTTRVVRAGGDARVAAVVVSAMSGVTDELIRIAHAAASQEGSHKNLLRKLEGCHSKTVKELVSSKNRAQALAHVRTLFWHLNEVVTGIALVKELSPGALDYCVSYGERLSAHILSDALNDREVKCEYLNARNVVVTDDTFGEASVDFAATNRAIKKYFRQHPKLQIVTGFIGATPDRKTTTLGRGGSDYSASIFGAALRARVIEIWTDVSGVMTADPRLVKGAKVVPELAFEEAGELAYFGAKVLHPKTILPAMREKIPVRVLNTFKPRDKGTTIVSDFAERRSKSHTVEALTFKRPVIVIHVQSPEFFDANGLMARIFEIFDEHRVSIDIVATSIAGVSLTIDSEKHLAAIVRDLKEFGSVMVEQGKAIVCAVGGSINAAGVAGRMFTVLGKRGIPVELISQAASGVSITFVVRERDAEKALKVLHQTYIKV